MIPDINLLPKYERRQSESKFLYILLGVIVLLLLSYFIWQFFSTKSQITTLQSEEANLIIERDRLQGEIENSQLQNRGTIGQSIEFIELISYPVSPIIDETQGLQPTNSYLREYIFEKNNVTIIVDFETLSDVSQYISRLTKSPYFIDGQVVSITNLEFETKANEETNFDVVPRQTAEIALQIDKNYLAAGGIQE